MPVKVLFVCIGNSCRSQMAETLARHMAPDVIKPSSAGISPLGEISEPTCMVLEERGLHMDGQYSKKLRPEDRKAADLIINMTGRPARQIFPAEAAKVEDWDVGDPYGEDLETYRLICYEIEVRLSDLAGRLRDKKRKPRRA